MLGVNHRSAPVERRELIALSLEEGRLALRGLAADAGLSECALLSTCNRTEIYAFSSDVDAAERSIRAGFVKLRGADLLEPGPHRYRLLGPEAASHLMRVAGGVDSMVLGEMQILGQVKDAYALAREEGALGVRMDKLMATAVRAGKRARAETAIGAGAVSVASAAVSLAAKVFDDLSGRSVVVVGAGETGRLAGQHFAERSPGRLRIANRTPERAAAVAAELNGEGVPLTELGAALADADVAVCATGSPAPVVTPEMVAKAMRRRPNRPLVLIDIAVPRNVDPAAERENVFLYAIDALQTIVDQSLARRRREVPRVEEIVREECDRYFGWLRGLDATPVLRELREHFERVRVAEVRKSLRHFSKDEQDRVERLTRSLVNKLLHLPTTRLKTIEPGSPTGLTRLDTVRELFGLDEEHEKYEVDRGA
jgi:glutamyl-tRNA reductase